MNRLFSEKTRLMTVTLIALLVLVPTSAFAYLDPGTGSFIIQAIIGAFVGGAFVAKMYWKRIKSKFTGKNPEDDDDIDE